MRCLLAITGFILIFQSCSFNNQFLSPSKIPTQAKQAQLIDNKNGDTLTVNIGNNYQPTFTDSNGDKVDLGYSIESVLFDNFEENTLNGWLMTPNQDYNGITLLFFHGNAGNITTQYQGIIPLVDKGFKVFIFDYCGFGFSEGKATRKNLLIDANAALDYVKNRPDPKRENLIIYGQSIGGHLAAVVGTENEEKIDGLVMEGAFSSHKDIAAEDAGFFGRLLTAEKYSALNSIDEFNEPVLIIHSTEDRTVPFELGQKLYDAANEPKSFYQIEKCHVCGPIFYADSIATKIKELVKGR
jgi:fermentation-respiration switch protein FrsA (DUF1100 family)